MLPRARAEDGCLRLDVGRTVVNPAVFVLSEGWRDLVDYRDVILQKDYYQEYLRSYPAASWQGMFRSL